MAAASSMTTLPSIEMSSDDEASLSSVLKLVAAELIRCQAETQHIEEKVFNGGVSLCEMSTCCPEIQKFDMLIQVLGNLSDFVRNLSDQTEETATVDLEASLRTLTMKGLAERLDVNASASPETQPKDSGDCELF